MKKSRSVSALTLFVAVGAVLVYGSLASARVAGDPLQPDLINLSPRQFGLTTTPHGLIRLHFATYTVNVGAGPMELRSRRLDCNADGNVLDDRTAIQHTYIDANGDGIFEPTIDTASVPHVAGCFGFNVRHGHWHFGNFAVFRLRSIKSGEVIAAHHKVGFCLVDDFATEPALPGAPQRPYYIRCTEDATQGISIGWTDIYSASLPSQWIDVTNVSPGRYCASVTVDPGNRLQESDDTNNTAGEVIRLTHDRVVSLAEAC